MAPKEISHSISLGISLPIFGAINTQAADMTIIQMKSMSANEVHVGLCILHLASEERHGSRHAIVGDDMSVPFPAHCDVHSHETLD